MIFFILDKYFYERINLDEQEEVELKGERIKVDGIWNLDPFDYYRDFCLN